MPLNLEDATRVIQKAQARAIDLGVRVCVAIVDEGGHLIALSRMDGASPLSPQIAESKAVGTAMLLREGGALEQLAQDRPGFFNAIDRMVRVPLIPGPGSVVITRGGKCVGAIGISGARPEQDLDCAEVGLTSLGEPA